MTTHENGKKTKTDFISPNALAEYFGSPLGKDLTQDKVGNGKDEGMYCQPPTCYYQKVTVENIKFSGITKTPTQSGGCNNASDSRIQKATIEELKKKFEYSEEKLCCPKCACKYDFPEQVTTESYSVSIDKTIDMEIGGIFLRDIHCRIQFTVSFDVVTRSRMGKCYKA